MEIFIVGSMTISLVALWVALFKVLPRIGVSKSQRNWGVLATALGTAGMFILIVSLAKDCFFCADPARISRTHIFLVSFLLSLVAMYFFLPVFRKILYATPPQWLLGFNLSRVIAGVTLIYYYENKTPGIFAIPMSAFGDVPVGLSAPLMAYWYIKKKPWINTLAIYWNIYAALTLVVSGFFVFFLMSSPLQLFAVTPSIDSATQYPLVLFPTFGVAVILFLNLYSAWYLKNHPIEKSSAS